MARIRKHRNKYQVLYRDPTTKKEKSAGVHDRRSDANKHKLTIERDIATGNWFDPNDGNISLQEWATLWQASTTALAPKTVSDYDSLIRTWILPTFGETSLSRITAMAVREWVADMDSHGLSARRTRKALMLLKQILNTAVDDRRIRSNPAAGVKGPKVRHRERPYLQPHEVRELADKVQERHRALILVMGVAGLRFGEAVALQRGDIDILRGTIRVSKSVSESHHVGQGGRVEVKSPKNDKARTVRIPRFLAEVLNEHFQAFTPADPEALVFPATNGALLRATNFCPQILRPGLASAGLNESVTGHDLRHSAAAAMIAVNPNPQLIKQQLGHGSISTTYDFYGHLFPDETDKLADALDAQWQSNTNESSKQSGPEADQAPRRLPGVGT
jgi:integrase